MSEFRHRLYLLLCVIALGIPSLPARAQVGTATGLTPPETLQRAAEALLRRRVSTTGADEMFVTAGALDSRLRLPACTTALDAFLPAGAQPAARTTVGVRCAAPYWTVYVPVTVETSLRVLVLKRAAARLASVGNADVEQQQRRVAGFPTTYVTDVSMLAGRHLRKAVPPGTALTVDLFATDLLVKRGQRVTLLSSVGGIEVRAMGEAMADAQPDGRVRVQNLGSRKVVEGHAESADRVRVGAP
jgi:flagella basal body P-ring formation protein FlgA